MERIKVKVENKTGLSIILLIGFSLLFPSLGTAQNSQARFLTLEDMLTISLEKSPYIKANRLEVEKQKVLKRTSFDINKTQVGMNYGEYNAPINDNSFSITQGLAFPTVYTNSLKLSNERIEGSEYQLASSKNEVVMSIKLLYYQLAIGIEKLKLLKYQDSLYNDFKKAATLRYKTGETAYLEKLAAETHLMEINTSIFKAEADINIYKGQLKEILGLEEDIIIPDSTYIYKLTLSSDSMKVIHNPYLQYLEQQIAINRAHTQVERSRLLPDLSIGVTSQTLIGYHNVTGNDVYYGKSNRFQYVSAIVGIPLWCVAQKARISSSKIDQQIAEANYEYQRIQMERELQTLTQLFLKYQRVTNYYEDYALPQANLTEEYAEKSYRAGESGYLDFIQNITEAFQIKLNYLETLGESNHTNINLEYIIGGKY